MQEEEENKNPLYALSQAQDDDIVTLDQSPGANRRFRPVEPGDMKGGDATIMSKGPVLHKPEQTASGSSSGSLSPVSTMQSKAMRARLDSREEVVTDHPKVNCKEKIVRPLP